MSKPVDVTIVGVGAFVRRHGDTRPRQSRKGDTITVAAEVAEKLIRERVAVRPEDLEKPEAAPELPGVFDARVLSDEELVDWLTDEQPDADAIAAAAHHDQATAARLLWAEGVVTDGNPRESVKAALSVLTGEAEQTNGDGEQAKPDLPKDYQALRNMAKELDLGLPGNTSKENLIAAISAKLAEQAEQTNGEGGGGNGD